MAPSLGSRKEVVPTLSNETPRETSVDFRILGRLEVRSGGETLALGAHKQRSLLALLLINANDVVSTDRILDELWGEDAAGKQNALWVYVSQLRSVLEPERAPRAESSLLLSRSPGYVLRVDPDQVDARRFERLLGEGRALLEGDPRAASLVLGEALALWRGTPLEDFTYDEFAQNEIARLAGLRVETVEERIEADLRSGRGPELVGELEALVREHPLRERLTGQLMLALYRAGRQAEALRVYKRLEARLGESLGIEPSPSTKRLEEQIVTQDPGLSPKAAVASGPAPGLSIRRYELREEIGRGTHGAVFRTFQATVGREVAIKVIRPALANDPDFIRRFEIEARTVARLEHPGIVPLFDYWREPDAAYLVMRLMRGGCLASVIEHQQMPEARVVDVVGQVADALAQAHRHGIVHRDIKPSNILLDPDGDAYLADFGIAGSVSPTGDSLRPAILDEPYASPEHQDRTALSARSDVYSLGVVLRELLGKASEQPGDSRLIEVAYRASAASPDDRYPHAEAFADELRGTVGAVSPPSTLPIENPYKGLHAFEERDSGVFFGRERLVERLVSRIGSPGSESRFVVLVGPSGSGKSSVVKAGLVPALRRGAVRGAEDWFIAEMVPGGEPFEELETALLNVAVDPPSALLEQLQADERGLRRVLDRIMPEDSSLVLVVDQFEELFTQTTNEETRKAFLDALLVAAAENPSRLRVVATLRADFYDRPLRYHDFGEVLRAGTEIITPMAPEELERAVAGPAEAVGAALEPGLAAAVISDVADEPTALPLMQYAMTELFERRKGVTLTADAYHDVGGVTGALGHRAEELYQLLDPASADAARQMFLRLLTLGGTGEDTRRRVLRSELDALDVRPSSVAQVLDVYGRHRLLTFDRDPVSRGPTVELAHEALIREWPRYRDWVDEARTDIRFQRRLALATDEWQRHEEDPDYLLSGSRLAETQAWRQSTGLSLTAAEDRFVGESSRHAEESRRSVLRRRRVIATVLAVVGALATAFLVFAFTQRSAANRLAAVEEINRIIESAEETLELDPDVSLLLSIAAAERSEDLGLEILPQNLDALHQGLRNHRLLFTVEGATSAVFSPDESTAYVGHGDGTVSLRDATTGEELGRIEPDLSSPGGFLAISADGRWITNGYWVGDTRDPDIVEGTWPSRNQRFANPVDVAIRPDGRWVAVVDFEPGAPDGKVTVWDVAEGRERWAENLVFPARAAFSPDGQRLAVTNQLSREPPSVILFETATGRQVEAIPTPSDVSGVVFHPDGDHLLVGGGNGVLEWDLASRDVEDSYGGHPFRVNDVSLTGDGDVLASGDESGSVIVRDGDTGSELFSLPHHFTRVHQVTLSSGGNRLATTTLELTERSGTLRVFDTSTEGGRDLLTVDTAVSRLGTVDVHPQGEWIAFGADDPGGTRQLWNLSDGSRIELPAHENFGLPLGINGAISFSPDGSVVATGGPSGLVRLWDSTDGSLLQERHVRQFLPDLIAPAGRPDPPVFAVEFGPEAEQLAVSGGDFLLVVDVESLDNARVLRVGELGFIDRVDFSADGERIIAGVNPGRTVEDDFTNPMMTWDVGTGEQIDSLETGSVVTSLPVDFSPSGDLLAVGTDVVTIRDARSLEILGTLSTDSREIRDVAFNPDGSLLAAAYLDGDILIWDPYAGEHLYSLEGHEGAAADLDWSDDGGRLVSVGLDGTLRMFAMDPQDLLDVARSTVTRDLTEGECRQYLGDDSC